jgi:hypothetical protein
MQEIYIFSYRRKLRISPDFFEASSPISQQHPTASHLALIFQFFERESQLLLQAVQNLVLESGMSQALSLSKVHPPLN